MGRRARTRHALVWAAFSAVSVAVVVASVAAAHWVSAEQSLSFVEDTKALPMGVFVTAADEAELEALEQDARWTSRLIVSDSGVAAAIALTSPADVFSAPYSLGCVAKGWSSVRGSRLRYGTH